MIIISFEKEFNSRKLKLFKSYIEELTVFINVRIPNLKDSSKFIPNIESSDVIVNTEIINTNTERKYLFINLFFNITSCFFYFF